MDEIKTGAAISEDASVYEPVRHSPARRSRTRWARLAVISAVIAVAVWLATPWVIARLTTVHINDARIAARVVTISSETAGRVTAIPVMVGDVVNKDDLIAAIDRESSQTQLDAVLSKLAATDAQLSELQARKVLLDKQLSARRDAAQAGIAAAEANHEASLAVLTNARTRHQRAIKLAQQNITSQQTLDEARAALDTASQQERAAFAAIENARASLAIVEADAEQLNVLESQIASLLAERSGTEADRSLKEIDLAHRTISARFDGIVDATFVDVGEYVASGTRIAMYHAPDDVWIDANVKETEFGRIHLGSRASITVDAFPGRTFDGEVIGMGGAATSQLALLPSPNPSGNFTKVTQRLPIRVEIDTDGTMLRPGMMVEVYVDVTD
ncbi:HlyD family secretion protein [Tritonibacter mobilis]|jgi:membrane fusion protein (multidrug efflux system)|uniref:HlyD family secretion protein n=1 Tax=Tritonibacter mobilis TaxID=379347 RepID=UPI00056A9826|nr:HlyD family secretion protein [Tritonibacter mobilis]NKX75274.1 HlyD family secretion protein [Rhodobacteraceae bacterium R_SAG3]